MERAASAGRVCPRAVEEYGDGDAGDRIGAGVGLVAGGDWALRVRAGAGSDDRGDGYLSDRDRMHDTGVDAIAAGADAGRRRDDLGIQPGRDEMFFGGSGPSAPRVPTSITTPGGVYQGPPHNPGIAAPQPLPAPRPPFYGTLELPEQAEDEGPPDGLTLDQAIELLRPPEPRPARQVAARSPRPAPTS